MVKYSNAPASNLRGIPYIIFDGVLFLQHNPEITIKARKQALFNIYSWVYAHHGEGKEKMGIDRLTQAFEKIQDKYQPIEALDYATPQLNEFINVLDEVQRDLYRIINNLEILKDAGIGDASFTDY